MQLFIAGVETDVAQFTNSVMDEVGPRRTQVKGVPYMLVIDHGAFIQAFHGMYAEWLDASHEYLDDGDDFEPPYEGAQAYPSLEEFMALPEHQRMQMVDTYFAFRMMSLFVRTNDNSRLGKFWRALTIDSLVHHGDKVTLAGKARGFEVMVYPKSKDGTY